MTHVFVCCLFAEALEAKRLRARCCVDPPSQRNCYTRLGLLSLARNGCHNTPTHLPIAGQESSAPSMSAHCPISTQLRKAPSNCACVQIKEISHPAKPSSSWGHSRYPATQLVRTAAQLGQQQQAKARQMCCKHVHLSCGSEQPQVGPPSADVGTCW